MFQPVEFRSAVSAPLFTDEEYYSSLSANNIVPLSPTEMAKDWESSPNEWYHLYLANSDFNLIISEPDIKCYSLCRCFFVGCNGSGRNDTESHCHALVHFKEHSSLKKFKSKLRKAGDGLNSRRTMFWKILCLDHAVDVLHYISCRYVEKEYTLTVRKGYHSRNQLHASRIVYDTNWLHDKGSNPHDKYTRCIEMRNKMSESAAAGLTDLSRYDSPRELHRKETCLCKRGAVGIQKEKDRMAKIFSAVEKSNAEFWRIFAPIRNSYLCNSKVEG